jgi:hypothetical protein
MLKKHYIGEAHKKTTSAAQCKQKLFLLFNPEFWETVYLTIRTQTHVTGFSI